MLLLSTPIPRIKVARASPKRRRIQWKCAIDEDGPAGFGYTPQAAYEVWRRGMIAEQSERLLKMRCR